jgi:DNA mismatch repair protein MutH
MRYLRVIASALVIAGMMFVSIASAQIQLRVNSGHRTEHPIVRHHRSRVHVRVNVPARRPVARHEVGQRSDFRPQEHHENR